MFKQAAKGRTVLLLAITSALMACSWSSASGAATKLAEKSRLAQKLASRQRQLAPATLSSPRASGYAHVSYDFALGPNSAARALTQAEQRAVRKIDNTIRDHLKPHDYTGTLRDMVGNPVPHPRGGFYDHVQEMNNSLRGLRKHAETLKNATDPAGAAARQRALDAIKKIEEFTRGAGL